MITQRVDKLRSALNPNKLKLTQWFALFSGAFGETKMSKTVSWSLGVDPYTNLLLKD